MRGSDNALRPRFTIGYGMIVVGTFAVVNAAVSWYLRCYPTAGAPARVSVNIVTAYTFVNLLTAFCFYHNFSQKRFRDLNAYKEKGSVTLPPETRRRLFRSHARELLSGLFITSWIVCAFLLHRWIAWNVWSTKRVVFPVLAIIMFTPVIVVQFRAAGWPPPRLIMAGVKRKWKNATHGERYLSVVYATVLLGFICTAFVRPWILVNMVRGHPFLSMLSIIGIALIVRVPIENLWILVVLRQKR
jgi:hypothetical protein